MIFKKEFYFIRHGQTDQNISPVKTDHGDIPLNAAGRQQATIVEPIIATLPIKTICCSPLKRALETKELVAARLSAKYRELDNLTECSTQEWMQMTALGKEAYLHPNDPVKSFMQRVLRGVNEALLQPGPVLIVAHGGIHWAMCCQMGVEHDWWIDNCVPVHFYLGNDGKWQAKKLAAV